MVRASSRSCVAAPTSPTIVGLIGSVGSTRATAAGDRPPAWPPRPLVAGSTVPARARAHAASASAAGDPSTPSSSHPPPRPPRQDRPSGVPRMDLDDAARDPRCEETFGPRARVGEPPPCVPLARRRRSATMPPPRSDRPEVGDGRCRRSASRLRRSSRARSATPMSCQSMMRATSAATLAFRRADVRGDLDRLSSSSIARPRSPRVRATSASPRSAVDMSRGMPSSLASPCASRKSASADPDVAGQEPQGTEPVGHAERPPADDPGGPRGVGPGPPSAIARANGPWQSPTCSETRPANASPSRSRASCEMPETALELARELARGPRGPMPARR